jgi:transposase
MVFIGVDSHKATFAVCVVDELGRELAHEQFANTREGHEQLLGWVRETAPAPRRFGVESTGWIAFALAQFLLDEGEQVCDVRGTLTDRQRKKLRGGGKSDPRDALAIARVVAREQLPPLRIDMEARELKLLCDYRAQLVSERTRTANRLHNDLLMLRPGYERQVPALVARAHLDAAEALLEDDECVQAALARRRLARLLDLDAELRELERQLRARVKATGSGLVSHAGISYLSAARIIGEVGDLRRIPSKSHFARLNGTAPIPASSGKTNRQRCNPGGNRRINHALHMMAVTQAGMEPRARCYLERKRGEGRSGKDALRALKRRLSDVVYAQLERDFAARQAPPT